MNIHAWRGIKGFETADYRTKWQRPTIQTSPGRLLSIYIFKITAHITISDTWNQEKFTNFFSVTNVRYVNLLLQYKHLICNQVRSTHFVASHSQWFLKLSVAQQPLWGPKADGAHIRLRDPGPWGTKNMSRLSGQSKFRTKHAWELNTGGSHWFLCCTNALSSCSIFGIAGLLTVSLT